MGRASFFGAISCGVVGVAAVIACGSAERSGFTPETTVPGQDSGVPQPFNDAGFGSSDDAGNPALPEGETRDPVDCDEAKTSKSYVGCDYWPTITPNAVW